MTLEEKYAFSEKFESLKAYNEWYQKAKAEYDKKQNVIEVGPDGNVDLSNVTGKKN